jgi:hypothetical protein
MVRGERDRGYLELAESSDYNDFFLLGSVKIHIKSQNNTQEYKTTAAEMKNIIA